MARYTDTTQHGTREHTCNDDNASCPPPIPLTEVCANFNYCGCIARDNDYLCNGCAKANSDRIG